MKLLAQKIKTKSSEKLMKNTLKPKSRSLLL